MSLVSGRRIPMTSLLLLTACATAPSRMPETIPDSVRQTDPAGAGVRLSASPGNPDRVTRTVPLTTDLESRLEASSQASITLRNKVVLLDFWATWCEPCRYALPFYGELHRTLGDRGLVVLGVNLNENSVDMVEYLKQSPIPFPVVSDPEGVLATSLSVTHMPTSFILDRKGVIRATHPGFSPADQEAIRQELKVLLDERVE